MPKNTSQIPNAYETVFSKEVKSSRHQFEQAEAEYQKGLDDVAQMIENSKLDAKLKQMLQVQMKNLDSAKTSKQIESFIKQYSQEAKLGKRQLQYLDRMKGEIENLREVEQDRFKAELKYKGASISGVKESYQRGGVKGAIDYGKTAIKTMSVNNMMKAGLHGVGVLADSPALNMLASSLNLQKDERSYEVSQELKGILGQSNKIGDKAKPVGGRKDEQTTATQTTKIADSNVEVVGELQRANKTLDEMLFRQKDMADDYKVTAAKTESFASSQETQKPTEDKKGSDWGIFGELFDKKKGRLGKLLNGGTKAGLMSGVGKAASVAGKVAPWALAATGAYGAYQGVGQAGEIFKTKDADLLQKISAGLGGLANTLSFGMVDTGAAAKGIHEGVSKVKDWATAGIGSVSAMFESGGKGAGVISSGKGDLGGKSYGSHQLSSKTGTLQNFLKSSGYGSQFSGMAVGSQEFDAKWKELAKNDPKFAQSQENFIGQTHYAPQAEKLKKSGLDVSKRSKALQSAVYSVGVQFGGGSSLVQNAMKEANLDPSKASDEQIIKSIYGYKKSHNEQLFKKSSSKVRAGTLQRAYDEEATVLEALKQEQSISPNVKTSVAPKAAVPSAALNSKTEQAMKGNKSKTLREELTGTDKIAAAVKAGIESANIVAVQAPGKKSDAVPLEDRSLDAVRLSGIK